MKNKKSCLHGFLPSFAKNASIISGALFLSIVSVSAVDITWPEAPTGETQGGKIGAALYPEFSTITETAKIGIGTNAPEDTFHVVGGGVFEQPIWMKNFNLSKYDVDGSSKFLTTKEYVDNALSGFSAGKFVDGTNTNDAVYTTGNVGIGTTNPNARLDLGQATGDGFEFLRMADSTNPTNSVWSFRQLTSGSMSDLGLYSKNTLVMQFYDSGTQHVSMPGRLTVGNFYSSANNFGVRGKAAIGSTSPFVATAAPIGGLIIEGNVGIGTTSPSAKLDVVTPGIESGFVARFMKPDLDNGNYASIQIGEEDGTSRSAVLRYSYHPTAAQRYLGLGTYGAEDSVVIKHDGNVGIGTSSPAEKLEVSGNIKLSNNVDTHLLLGGRVETQPTTTGYVVTSGGGGGDGFSDFGSLVLGSRADDQRGIYFQTGASRSTKMYITGTGNVGIGTSSPAEKLEVNGTIKSNKLHLTGRTDAILFDNASYAKFIRMEGRNTGIAFNNSQASISLVDQGNNDAIIVRSGAVGIYNANPSAALDVNGNIIADAPTADNHVATKAYVDANSSSGGKFVDGANANNAVYTQGNVGIGTEYPDYPLQINISSGTGLYVNSSVNTDGGQGVTINRSAANGEATLAFATQGSSKWLMGFDGGQTGPDPYGNDLVLFNMTSLARIISFDATSNNVGIGPQYSAADDPDEKLVVVGNVKADAYLYNSDERLKENISSLENGLETINSIKAVHFDWIESGKNDTGFIAQDIEKYYPEFVHEGEQSGYKAVDYSKMVVPLVAAVQELSAQNQALKALVCEDKPEAELCK